MNVESGAEAPPTRLKGAHSHDFIIDDHPFISLLFSHWHWQILYILFPLEEVHVCTVMYY